MGLTNPKGPAPATNGPKAAPAFTSKSVAVGFCLALSEASRTEVLCASGLAPPKALLTFLVMVIIGFSQKYLTIHHLI